jgi:hypothetical protein
MAEIDILCFSLTGAGRMGRAQLTCEQYQIERYYDLVQFILESKPFIVHVNNDGRTLVANSGVFPPFDPFPQTPQLRGWIRSGETKHGIRAGAKHEAFRFFATGKDVITAEASFANGHAIAFLTDHDFRIIAQSEVTMANAHIRFQIPPGPGRTMHIVFKEKNGKPGPCKVRLSLENGSCSGPGGDPYRIYRAVTQEECSGFPGDCPATTQAFTNRCGCGCERSAP